MHMKHVLNRGWTTCWSGGWSWCLGALVSGLLWAAPSGSAAAITETLSSSPGLTIPDGSVVGISDGITMPATIASITEVSVTLDIQGGFTGDLYGYLQHDSGLAILLNRSGRTGNSGAASLGYLDSGYDITLRDSAVNGDVHGYQSVLNPAGGALTGVWQPDGRAVSPSTVDGTEARTAMLSTFTGGVSDGVWTLFLADLSPGGVSVLQGWSLEITGTAVPEPGFWAGVSGTLLLGFAVVRRLGGGRACRKPASPPRAVTGG